MTTIPSTAADELTPTGPSKPWRKEPDDHDHHAQGHGVDLDVARRHHHRPVASAGTPLHGDDPGRLHDWQFTAATDVDRRVIDELYASTGAVVIGRRMFDVGFEPWGDPPPFGRPVFVLTHEHRDPLPMQGDTTYHFVADGIEECLDQARAAAAGKDVSVWGGGQTLSEFLRRGLLHELEIHLVPIILGEGIRLFQGPGLGNVNLRRTRCIETPAATHLRFQVARG